MEVEQEPSLQQLEALFAKNNGSHAVPVDLNGKVNQSALAEHAGDNYSITRALQANSIYTGNLIYPHCDNPFTNQVEVNANPALKLNPKIETTAVTQQELLQQVGIDLQTIIKKVEEAIEFINQGGVYKTPVVLKNGNYLQFGPQLVSRLKEFLQNLQGSENLTLTPAMVIANVKGKLIPVHTPLSKNENEFFVDGGFCDDFENTSFFINEQVFAIGEFGEFTLVTTRGKTSLVPTEHLAQLREQENYTYTYFIGTDPKIIVVNGKNTTLLPGDKILQAKGNQYLATKGKNGTVEYIDISNQFNQTELAADLSLIQLINFAASINVPYNTLYECSSFVQRLLATLQTHPEFMRYSGDISNQLNQMVGSTELTPQNLQNLTDGVYVYNFYRVTNDNKEKSVHTGFLVVQNGNLTSISQAFSIKSINGVEHPKATHVSNQTIDAYVNSTDAKVRVHKISA